MLKSLQALIVETTAGVRCIDSAVARAEMKANQGVLIDVREPGEADHKSVSASRNIPRGVLEMKITDYCPDAATRIYIHCATGDRARLAAEQLGRMGYENVSAISCGLDAVCEAFGHG